ncbi:hypothetical protein DFH07DRAFT_1036195 [Mycena maculata]|uniref:Uncharacterized protein n=1 Tax=Mycena maculata TaxID=230809 RepID=A0AAD7K6L3_9AGAR|nr:hypothetical protein DFH07DRAFT_1036195 [Mycena maculata]
MWVADQGNGFSTHSLAKWLIIFLLFRHVTTAAVLSSVTSCPIFLSSRTSKSHFSDKTTQISVSKSHILDSKIANFRPQKATFADHPLVELPRAFNRLLHQGNAKVRLARPLVSRPLYTSDGLHSPFVSLDAVSRLAMTPDDRSPKTFVAFAEYVMPSVLTSIQIAAALSTFAQREIADFKRTAFPGGKGALAQIHEAVVSCLSTEPILPPRRAPASHSVTFRRIVPANAYPHSRRSRAPSPPSPWPLFFKSSVHDFCQQRMLRNYPVSYNTQSTINTLHFAISRTPLPEDSEL